jgi:nitroimidazol reductase NimA-like FMN-containing flavoprotein (pyridoxamine 5'-phosphate oxidase superfamily)
MYYYKTEGNPLTTAYDPTPRTTPTRYRERAHYERETVHRILDEALICHLGYLSAGRPVVLPTTHARLGETLYLHGSTGSGPMLSAKATPPGLPVCVTATLVDALVLARSALHHSLAYRSVVVVGDARLVEDPAEKLRALHALLDHIAPGRAADCRTPNARELAATALLALDLVEVSAKVRTGGPVDEPEDLTLPHWAGVLPLTLAAGTPVPADDLDPATPLPSYLANYRERACLYGDTP